MKKPAAQAVNTVRGFHTPVVSDVEDSDYSASATPRHQKNKHTNIDDVVSNNAHGSPMLRSISNQSATIGGISKLKTQIESLDLENGLSKYNGKRKSKLKGKASSSTGTSEMSDDEMSVKSETSISYDIPLEHDFASAEVRERPIYAAVEGGLIQDTVARKMQADDFEPLRCLGKGTYGTVILVKQRTTGRLYAQKTFRKASLTVHQKLVEQTKTERTILESINRHPFVVKLFYAFQDHEKLYLILEYAQGGELFTHLAQERMFTEETASFYMAEMVLALEHLHKNLGVVYRDLKPENCLLDSDGHLLLTDFGLSKVPVDDDDHCKSMLGTVEYMAPEVVQGNKYGMAVDWWSLGALGFDLLTGSPPFQANNHAKIQEKIVKQKLVMPYFLGPDAKDLLTRFLRKEPNKRLGANMPKDMATIKKHRFFRKIDWVKLAKREVEPPIQPFITDPELAENFSEDFTDLAVSPVVERANWESMNASNGIDREDPFGGFSYVASKSLLDSNGFGNVV